VRVHEEPHVVGEVLVIVYGIVWRVAVVAEVLRECEDWELCY